MSEKITNLVNQLSNLTLPEAAALAKALREKWGITETVHPIMKPANDLVTEIEKADAVFNVVLKSCGANKIPVIRVIRETKNLGLAEAKKLSETADAVIGESLPKDEAKGLLEKLTQAGGVGELVGV